MPLDRPLRSWPGSRYSTQNDRGRGGRSFEPRSETNDLRVLHLTSRWGGGIKTVVQQYVSALPDVRHYLLAREDPWNVPESDGLFHRTESLDDHLSSALKQITLFTERYDIDIIHAHSSHAGALARLTRTAARVVYTPNAFATMSPRFSRTWWNGQSERALGVRPITIAAVSDVEAKAARRYAPTSRVVRIINLPSLHLKPTSRHSTTPRVVMCGRICAQKGADYFAGVAKLCHERDMRASFEWMGDGDLHDKDLLVKAGVTVHGWLALPELHTLQAAANIYLHSGIYEGACLSVLDAAAMGLPSIGRPVPGIAELPWIHLARDPADAVAEIARLIDRSSWQAASALATKAMVDYTQEVQAAGLMYAYGVGTDCALPDTRPSPRDRKLRCR